MRDTVQRCLWLACLAVTAASSAWGAGYDPAWTWRTVTTPHFRIHYHDGLEAAATDLARLAEEVHGPMTEVLGWTPRERTEVTLVDQTDLANGYATVLPYNQIVLYAARPELFQSIGDYGGWLKTLFVHEYAHVLGLDPVRGYPAVLRKIFGRVGVPLTPTGALFWFFAAPPNLFLPPWFHEGMATALETDFTGRGRKGSTWYRMIYRADVAEGTIPPLDRLGGDFPDWPSLSTRYVYGARLMQLVEDRHGREALGRLAIGHSGRFPYTIDRPAAQVTGFAYQGLYQEMLQALDDEYRPEIDRLRGEGLTPTRAVTRSGYVTAGPRWLGAETLAVTRADPHGPAQLLALELPTGRERTLAQRPGGSGAPTPLGGGELAYTRIEVARPWAGGRLYSDLYAAGPNRWGGGRLTRGARVRSADWSPAARAYVAVRLEGLSQRLVLLDGSGESIRELLGEPGVRYDAPRWSPDGATVAFGRKTDHGHSRLALLDVATGQLRLVTPEGTQAGFPAWSPDGTRLAFAWDRSGVFDLYALELASGQVRRLTRLLGGAFEPDWSPDGRRLAFTAYSARGFDVALLDLADALEEPVDLPAAEAAETPSPEPVPASPLGAPYSAWPRVLPTFWLPDLAGDHQGLAVGAWTTGHDPLYRHLYYAAGYWAGASRRPYGLAMYINDASYPTVTAAAWKLPALHGELLETPRQDYDYWEEDRGARLEARLTLPRALRAWSFAASWAWQEVARLSRIDEDLDGRRDLADRAFQGRVNPLALSLLYDSTFPRHTRFTLGPEGGRRLEATYRLRHRATGADLDRQELLGEWREYWPIPGAERTVVALWAKGGAARGDETLQGAFPLGGTAGEFPLRGYPARVDRGEGAAVGSLELRFPLWSPFRGIWDWPVFLGRLHGAAFVDVGRTWRGGDGEWRRGAGAELRIDTLLGYYFPTTVTLGYAHGFDRDGGDHGYLSLGLGL